MNISRTAALDTNVLLLKLVAETDRSLLGTFKRVNLFTLGDVPKLASLLEQYQELVTTPHVLAEVSNFLDQAPAHRRADLIRSFSTFIQNSREAFERAKQLVTASDFESLGITDTALLSLSSNLTVVTTDYELWGRIVRVGGNCVNFNHFRTADLLKFDP